MLRLFRALQLKQVNSYLIRARFATTEKAVAVEEEAEPEVAEGEAKPEEEQAEKKVVIPPKSWNKIETRQSYE